MVVEVERPRSGWLDRVMVRQHVLFGVPMLFGFALLWWSHEQFEVMRLIAGSEFRYPEGRMLIWTLTVVAAGFSFGFAVTRRAQLTSSRAVIATWTVVPAGILFWFYASLVLGWTMFRMPLDVVRFVTSQDVVIGSALVLGFSLSALMATGAGDSSVSD